MNVQPKDIVAIKQFRNLKYIISYGSPHGLDKDYFAIFNQSSIPYEYTMVITGDDIYPETLYQFKRGLLLFDPLYTEPVLTGKVIYGQDQFYINLKHRFLSIKSSSKAVKYLIDRGKICIDSAEYYLKLYKNDRCLFNSIFSLLNMSYCASYIIFADYYSTPNSAISLSNVLNNCSDNKIKDIYALYKDAKRGMLLIYEEIENHLNYINSFFER